MVVRARSSIPAGTEIYICIPYVSVDDPDSNNRSAVLDSHFRKTACPYSLCELDRQDGAVNLSRRKALEQVRNPNKTLISLSPAAYETALPSTKRKIELLLAELNETYSTSRPAAPRPDLVLPYHLFAEMHPFDPRTVSEGARYDLKALEAAGTVLETSKDGVNIVSAPVCAQGLAVEYLLLIAFRRSLVKTAKEKKETRIWGVQAAFQMSRIFEGDNPKRFKARFAEELGRRNLAKHV